MVRSSLAINNAHMQGVVELGACGAFVELLLLVDAGHLAVQRSSIAQPFVQVRCTARASPPMVIANDIWDRWALANAIDTRSLDVC
jgi:hypothetical protein